MAIKLFPWDTIGDPSKLDITEIAHTVKHPYGGGYHASRKEGTKMQKQIKIGWDAMAETRWLAFMTFWRSVGGDAEAFHFEYPITVDGWDIGLNPSAALADPGDGFDLELDDSTVSGDSPIFLVNFTTDNVDQSLLKNVNPARRFRIITSVTEVA